MKELRIGLVLYGGVSLAVYINGVVTEVWNLLRASESKWRTGDGNTGGADPAPGGVAAVYREILNDLPGQRGFEGLRVVVDAVSGTSAGGVNGVALAKAIVEGGDASELNRVWIEDADIARLKQEPAQGLPFFVRTALWLGRTIMSWLSRLRKQLEDLPGVGWAWATGHAYSVLKLGNRAATPLDGDYFAGMIAKTLRRMTPGAEGRPLLPRSGSFDLLITGTDLHGWPRHLPVDEALHAGPLYERTHAHVFHFRRPPGGGRIDDDFGLTYAGRSTASFPVAFGPTDYPGIRRHFADPPITADFAARHLREHQLQGGQGRDLAVERIRMVDGGVLDNKPFSRLVEAIERKPAAYEVFRTLIYVEPDPETAGYGLPEEAPGPLQVAGGLYPLFRHEPIIEDLRRLEDRNAQVLRIRALAEAGQAEAERILAGRASDAGQPWPPAAGGDFTALRRLANETAASGAVSGYAGYVALKARRAAETMALVICRAFNYPRASRQAYFIRRLVRAWFDRQGCLTPPEFDASSGGFRLSDGQFRLLQAFDIGFRLRRLRALIACVNGLYDRLDSGDAEGRRDLDGMKADLGEILLSHEALVESPAGVAGIVRARLGDMLGGRDLDAEIGSLNDTPDAVVEQHKVLLAELYDTVSSSYAEKAAALNEWLGRLLANSGPGLAPVRTAFATFPVVDVAVYPVMDTAGLAELCPVRAMRVSPHDATALSQDPGRLMGRELGAFAGFLKREAREHDLAWGRLDGAERLLDLVLLAAGVSADAEARRVLAEKYRPRLFKAILDEERARPSAAAVRIAERYGL